MHNIDIKHKAKSLRYKGISIQDIVDILNIKKSTVSYWCRDIHLSEKSIKKIVKRSKEKINAGLLRYSEKKRKERIVRELISKKAGSQIVGNLSKRDKMMTGFGLYWGEGYKKGELGFTNSSPKIIRFYITWLELFDIYKDNLIFRLTINNIFKTQEKKLKHFWTDFLGVSAEQFTKTTIIKSKLKKASFDDINSYKGILRVKVRKGLSLRLKIIGAIDHIYNQVNLDIVKKNMAGTVQ